MRRAVLAVATAGVLVIGAAQTQPTAQSPLPPSPPPSGASPRSSLPEQNRTSLPEVIDIDLATLPDGGAVTRAVTPGRPMILDVRRRPAGSPLRVVVEGGGAARIQHDLPAVSGITFPANLPIACAPVRDALESMIAARRVREADAAELRLNQIDLNACPELRTVLIDAFQKSHPFLQIARPVQAGGSVQITIEQLAPGGGVSTTWSVALQAESPERPWAHANEQEWLAAAIVRDIAGSLAHATRAKTSPQVSVRTLRQTPTGNAVVRASVAVAGRPEISQEIVLDPHVFEPGAYTPFARAAAAALGVRPTPPEMSIGLPERLTHLRAAVLERESARVGEWLTRHPLDPAANEEAALIHLALALRESAGVFTDVRASVARATAHLAIASLAGKTPGASGRIGGYALRVSIGRQTEVLPALNAALANPATPPEERAWSRALVLRVTGDWRIASEARGLSLLERLALYRAIRSGQGGLRALDLFDAQKPENVADWSWIALSGPFTVDEGNMFAGAAFPATVAEMSAVVLKKEHVPSEPSEIATALRATAQEGSAAWTGTGARIRVLDPALWTAFFSRHLAQAADAGHLHNSEMLGMPERADAFAAQVQPYLADTPWSFSLPALRNPMTRGSRNFSLPCGPFGLWVSRRPETVPATLWEKAMSGCPMVRDPATWFAGPAIPGTVVGLAERRTTRVMMTFDAVLPRLQAIAPHDDVVAAVWIAFSAKTKDPIAIARAFGARKDYTLSVMQRLQAAEGTEARERRTILEKMCEISADECGRLGFDLKESGEEAAAAVAFERELAGARDRVRMSNEMHWLALYYLQLGRADDAERVARAAAETYSHAGLTVLGRVLDRRGRLPEAAAVFKAVEERYADRRELDLFLLRAERRAGGEVFREEARQVRERIFPKGLERVTLANFSGPPTEGVEILHDTKGVKELGLAKGDVIVAFDGYRTRNMRQYEVVREMSEDLTVRLLAWSASRKAYVAASARLLDRRTGSDLRSFPYRPGVE